MSEELAIKLDACSGKGYVIAPAGYGKTHLIAMAVKVGVHRQLILTHTFAGVNSIKTKMSALGVPPSRYQIDTIASWSLRLCLAYPKNSGWKIENPTGNQWSTLYECCSNLLKNEFVRRVVKATYAGVYVDEYQDCSDLQHALVCTLAEVLPSRILGDPMQAIFDFDGSKLVDWDANIYPHFACLGQLEKPWRWDNAGQPLLGAWLKAARKSLEQGQKIDLINGLPTCVKRAYTDAQYLPSKQYAILCEHLGNTASVIALLGGDQVSKSKTHRLARTMAGRFSSLEEVEGKALFSFVKKLDSAETTKAKFLHVLDFAKDCFTAVDKTLTAGTKLGNIAKETKATKYRDLLAAANLYLTIPTSRNLKAFFLLLKDKPETSAYRRDLLYRFLGVLELHIDGAGATYLEAANLYQREMRHTGRPIMYQKLIGTTLLVKGLEYDHAVILDADSLGTKDLYVAMTRGAKSLTIICSGRSLPGV